MSAADFDTVREALATGHGLVYYLLAREALDRIQAREKELLDALELISVHPTSVRNPDGDEQAAHEMQLIARTALRGRRGSAPVSNADNPHANHCRRCGDTRPPETRCWYCGGYGLVHGQEGDPQDCPKCGCSGIQWPPRCLTCGGFRKANPR